MMRVLHKIRNFILYCGIEKDEYKAVKKGAYASNFEVWRILHCLITAVFSFLTIFTVFSPFVIVNRPVYLISLIYYTVATFLFLFVLKKDSIIAQLIIYLSISMLFLLAAFVSQNNSNVPATAFIALLLISPMFMIDKPYFMAIELFAASAVFVIWMYHVKPYDVWKYDLANAVLYSIVGVFLHIIANSIRIKEFVLTRKINIQKDTDELTGIRNKGAVTREINEFLTDETRDRGIMFLIDINHFKSINDTYGHDVGDAVISRFGEYLKKTFTNGEIVGRFGGDEFLVFIKDTNDRGIAEDTARRIVDGAADHIELPDRDKKISVGIGIALYHGQEKNYSEIFKKADVALYKTKSDRTVRYNFYDPAAENA